MLCKEGGLNQKLDECMLLGIRSLKKHRDVNFPSMSTAWPIVSSFGSNLALLS